MAAICSDKSAGPSLLLGRCAAVKLWHYWHFWLEAEEKKRRRDRQKFSAFYVSTCPPLVLSKTTHFLTKGGKIGWSSCCDSRPIYGTVSIHSFLQFLSFWLQWVMRYLATPSLTPRSSLAHGLFDFDGMRLVLLGFRDVPNSWQLTVDQEVTDTNGENVEREKKWNYLFSGRRQLKEDEGTAAAAVVIFHRCATAPTGRKWKRLSAFGTGSQQATAKYINIQKTLTVCPRLNSSSCWFWWWCVGKWRDWIVTTKNDKQIQWRVHISVPFFLLLLASPLLKKTNTLKL